MHVSSNEVKEHRCDISDVEYNRSVPFDMNRPPPFSISTSPSYYTPPLPVKCSSWKRLSFGKFSSQPIRLSILKLDGSSFDITVTNRATVAKVKQAVEAAFSHLPKQGDGRISWSHVWGHFSLCFENMKLLRDRDSITRFGIQNGDQLQFVRHTPIYEIAGERLENLTYGSDEPEGSSKSNQQNTVQNEVNEGFRDTKCRSRGLFSHRRTEGQAKGNDRIVHSKTRLGQPFSRDVPCRLGNEYSSSSFSDFTGGFGYPTGYCMK